ncbi:LysM peptidoglycan-binding domain-containing protein [Cytobacillus firmus]|uniref:cell division suppressor protein YneA n=1 Tax=Cytobacillus firmus TaxID=1399 RepID=UPI00237A54A0|nr:LysM peptidoglycan-binding domain-containing protein [Cytobacillus firmus]MDD9309805.1 LysM peptidoglycan-binding domain-containing protein [Cytobacillus firmus]
MKGKDLFFLMLFLISLSTFTAAAVNEFSIDQEDFAKVEVQPGDTIWDYAELFKEHHKLSPADFVAWVEENNAVFNGQIQIGQTLVLPIDEKALATTQEVK